MIGAVSYVLNDCYLSFFDYIFVDVQNICHKYIVGKPALRLLGLQKIETKSYSKNNKKKLKKSKFLRLIFWNFRFCIENTVPKKRRI